MSKVIIRLAVGLACIMGALALFSRDQPAQALSAPMTKVTAGTKAITAAATQITTTSGCSMMIGNLTTTKVWVGGSGVSTATGFPICSDTLSCYATSVEFEASPNAVFAITTDGGTVNFLLGQSCR